jgi:hypothetical protein
MSSDAVTVAMALGVAAVTTLLGVWFATWISGFRRGRPTTRIRPPAVELPPPVTAGVNPRQLMVLARELAAHADAAAAQAVRANAELDAAQAALTAAEAARARAEAEYDAARGAHLAVGTGHAGRPAEPDPHAQAREREASRAALDAYRRGELPVEVLQTVFGRAEPDPRQDEWAREADRLALAEAQARRAFDRAVVVARMAREDLHVAEIADAATQQEAIAAAMEAQEAQIALQAVTPAKRRGSSRRRASGTTHPAPRRAAR